MKTDSSIKKRIGNLNEPLQTITTGNKVPPVQIDATGDTQTNVDNNFDILRGKFIGTDFEENANCACNLMSGVYSGLNNPQMFNDLLMAIKDLINPNGQGCIHDSLGSYDSFINEAMSVLGGIHKAAMNSEAEAKLMELESYLNNMGLNERENWKKYRDNARMMAANGDASFNATPQLEQEDLEYLRERNRKKTVGGNFI